MSVIHLLYRIEDRNDYIEAEQCFVRVLAYIDKHLLCF